MLRKATSKLKHNPTVTTLRGINQDLKLLQNVISAEKTVLLTLRKLSADYAKSSEALRAWGVSQGDDLGGILTASSLLLNHFSSALSQYAEHGYSIRRQIKAIRTREESLNNLKRDQRTIQRKVEDADKQLRSIDPEHKNFTIQTNALNSLRKDLREIDLEIKSEEAALGDFKRTATKMWMGLKFGGLVECCEKGVIAGKFGKLVITEIPEEMTQPGSLRRPSYRRSEVEACVAEAHLGVNAVTLSTVPLVGFRDRYQYVQRSSDTGPSDVPAFYISPPAGPFSNERRMSVGSQVPQTFIGEPLILGESQPPPQSILDADDASYLQAIQIGFRSLGNQPPYSRSSFVLPDEEVVESWVMPVSEQLGYDKGAVDHVVHSTGTGLVSNLNPVGGQSQSLPPAQQVSNEGAVGHVVHSTVIPPVASLNAIGGQSNTIASLPSLAWPRAPGTFGGSAPDPFSIRARPPVALPVQDPPLAPVFDEKQGSKSGGLSRFFRIFKG